MIKVVGCRFYGQKNQYTEYTSDGLIYEDHQKLEAENKALQLKKEGFTNAHTVTRLTGEEMWLCDILRAERNLPVL